MFYKRTFWRREYRVFVRKTDSLGRLRIVLSPTRGPVARTTSFSSDRKTRRRATGGGHVEIPATRI
jgi:hypothetical protein